MRKNSKHEKEEKMECQLWRAASLFFLSLELLIEALVKRVLFSDSTLLPKWNSKLVSNEDSLRKDGELVLHPHLVSFLALQPWDCSTNRRHRFWA